MVDFKLPTNVTREMILRAVERDEYIGYCVSCGDQADHIEPDARAYRCGGCGECMVYGAEELLLMFG